MSKLYITLFIITFHYSVSGQQSDYFTENNSFNHLYRQENIKESRIYASDFNIWFINFKYLEKVQYFDTTGNLIKEREYLDRDKSDGWEIYYHYNEKRQLTYSEWYWLDNKQWEKSEYKYNEDGDIISKCESHRHDSDANYFLDNCIQFVYKNGKIDYVLSPEADTIEYYTANDKTLIKYSKGEVESEYKDNLKSKYYTKDKIYTYEYNQLGQLTKTTIHDYKSNSLGTVNFIYKKGLPFRDIYKNSKGRTLDKAKYQYKRYKKNSS